MESKSCQFKQYNKKYKEYTYCKFPICKNENNLPYCGNHLPLGEVGPNGKMTKCPLCGQIIGEKILEKHKKKCSEIQKKKVPEISNNDIKTPRLWNKKDFKISDIPEEAIKAIRDKINQSYDKFNISIEKSVLLPEEFLSKFKQEELTGKNSKNLLQEISIASNLQKEGLFLKDSLFIELGCGAGSLSKTIQIGTDYQSSHLLIDRMKYNSKNRYDHVLKSHLKNGTENFVLREVIDIQDLDISKYNCNNVVNVSKHLCGAACELALNKVIDFTHKGNFNLCGVGIATCCHYLLNKENYCNCNLFKEIGITEDEFDFMTRLSSWGTLKDENDNYSLGKKIKNLLDYGRVLYLKENGFKDARILEYTDETKENTMIVAKIVK